MANSANEIVVRYQDGSAVHMTFLQEEVVIDTRYGQLTVPTEDIHRMDFGLRLPDGLRDEVEAIVKDLAAGSAKVRESAGRQLLKIGVNALPVLMRVARGRNQEMAQAAQTLAQELRERVPPAQLRFREEDLVQTPDFSIVGRVVAPTLKARSPYFGPVDLKVSQLVGLRRVGELREVTLTIDAEQYANGKRNWLDTRVAVEAGAPLTITATGEVDLWPLGGETGVYVGNPSGSAHGCGYGQGYGMEGREEHSGGTLLGRIGQGGSVFKVGERYCGTANQSGRLFLRIAPSPWGNASSGAYKVRITAADSGSDWPAGEQELSDL